MTAFSTMVSQIQAEANDTSTRLKTLIEQWINDEHHRLVAMRNWEFLVVERSDVTSIAVAAIPFDIATIKVASTTTPALRILAVVDTTDGSEYPLDFTTLSEVRSNDPSANLSSGTPRYWHYEGDKINFYPRLSATRTFLFTFSKASKTYSTGSGDALLIPDRWISVLNHKVMERVWKYKTDERWATAKQSYDEALKDMIKSCTAKAMIQYAQPSFSASRLPRLSADA